MGDHHTPATPARHLDERGAQWLPAFAERLPDLVAILSPVGQTLYLNPAGRQLLGVPTEGSPPLRLNELHPPEELGHIYDVALPAAIRDGAWSGRTAMLAACGHILPVRLTITTHRGPDGGLAAIGLVAQDLRGYEDEVRERRERERLYNAMVEHSLDMIAVLDEHGQTIHISPSVTEVLGLTPEEALHTDNWSRIHADDVQDCRHLLEALLVDPKTPVRTRLRYRHKAGHWITLDLHAVACLDDPDVGGILTYIRDVTDLAGQEEALQDRVDELQDLHANRALLLDAVAHDMNQPLSPIMLQVHVLKHLYAATDPKVEKALRIIEENARRLGRFVNDFRDVSRIDRDGLELDVRRIDLATRAVSVTRSLSDEAGSRGIRLECLCFGSFPVDADPDRVDQVLFNLVRNALKFTPKGGRVVVHLDRLDDRVQCTVADTGRGLAGSELARVFEPFVQVHRPGEATEKGTGLGLAICRGIIQRHGGRIWAESDGPGQGARFLFTLPLAPTTPRPSSG